MVAINSNLFEARLNTLQQQRIIRSGNINEQNISLFSNTEGLTQGMIDGSCVDGNDDGKIGFWEGAKSFGKGIVKNFTNMFSSPKNFLKTLAVGAGCVALTVATGGAATPFLIAGGAALGAAQAGKGIYNATQAKTDAEKRAALEDIGGGTANIAMSVVAAKGYTAQTGNSLIGKGSLSTYKNAAVDSATALKTNFGKATGAIKTAGTNFKNNAQANIADFKQGVSERAAVIEYQNSHPIKVNNSENGFVMMDEAFDASQVTNVSKASVARATVDETAARLRSSVATKKQAIANKANDFKSLVKSNMPEEGQIHFGIEEDGQLYFDLSENNPSTVKLTPELGKAVVTSVKQMSSEQLSNAKAFIASAKDNMNVSQMISKLGEMGLDKKVALELINSSNAAVNMIDDSEFETAKEFSFV